MGVAMDGTLEGRGLCVGVAKGRGNQGRWGLEMGVAKGGLLGRGGACK